MLGLSPSSMRGQRHRTVRALRRVHTAGESGQRRGGEVSRQADASWPVSVPAAPPESCLCPCPCSPRCARLSRRPRKPGRDEREPFGLGHPFPVVHPHSVDGSRTSFQTKCQLQSTAHWTRFLGLCCALRSHLPNCPKEAGAGDTVMRCLTAGLGLSVETTLACSVFPSCSDPFLEDPGLRVGLPAQVRCRHPFPDSLSPSALLGAPFHR